MQMAAAIEILLHAPVRMSNLIAIDVGEHLVRPGGSKGLYYLAFREDETKNAERLEYELPAATSSLVEEYLNVFLPLFAQSAGALFPSHDRPRKSQGTLASQIGEVVDEYTGLSMTPHQFRHLAAAMILDQHPNALHLVQRMLGHKSPKTTLRFYAGLNPRSTSRLMANVVKTIREP